MHRVPFLIFCQKICLDLLSVNMLRNPSEMVPGMGCPIFAKLSPALTPAVVVVSLLLPLRFGLGWHCSWLVSAPCATWLVFTLFLMMKYFIQNIINLSVFHELLHEFKRNL